MKTQELQETFNLMLDDKIDEVRARIKFFKSDECDLSKNTKSTQLFQRNRDLKILKLIQGLINDNVTASDKDTLISLTTLISEREAGVVKFTLGENLIDILARYQDVKNVKAKIDKVLEKNGWGIDYADNGKIKKL